MDSFCEFTTWEKGAACIHCGFRLPVGGFQSHPVVPCGIPQREPPDEDRVLNLCGHLGFDTGRTIQCGSCSGVQTGIWTCDLFGEYCLPLAKQSVAGMPTCLRCSGYVREPESGA